ncbi:hypothetical protein AVEN_116232-1 [Araneus ventricosus]|uniref:PiggyBac transposable element-derived protein domain-containing protein n=1 Tax=Araneus ventricosus TaxID=182803 RepID=A0A4Y2VHK3_ARAVE|nr:hypothetical protein AVEN_116232-1 [Araneus ventricosus]
MTGTCFSNILDFAAINGWVIYKEVIGTKIKRRDYILNLAEELRKTYASSKRATLSDFPPGTDDGPTASSRKSKHCRLNRCRNKTIYISCDAKRTSVDVKHFSCGAENTPRKISKSPWEMEQQRLRNLLASVSSDSEDDEAAGTDDNFLDDVEHFKERS